ncbi:MAG: short-chain dehydrogenase [Betaproteobacteria bacterium RIFCSPHIGHO2_12_FULL_69_13]|nr:MAG: short-chain dehydrogenase [Betaproteobacteria bacterium RIFCSPHIGHO2_12_FULL_69_13]OGA68646.1 MAG: short-chain dehydrogenase [Betaproteobacteria bacterium RIFCSPLOWO2_12_FULL_68_20]
MDLNLNGKRVLVTGGSKGIGFACANVFADEGAEVRIASRNPPAGGRFAAKAIDLSRRGAPEELAAWAGDLDILVNNAGAIPGGDLLKVDEQTWRHAWDLKVFGYINLTRAVYARMKAARRGVIVNIIGGAGEKLNASYIAGSTANAGLMAFTRALGGVSHADGVRIVGINPGPVATDRLTSLYRQQAEAKLGDASRYRELFAGMSFGRPAAPEEIAWAAAFLASERAAYISGCILTIDGGAAARPG